MFKSKKIYCQSCAMPISKNLKHAGTEENGEKSSVYCMYCYQNGAFTEPNITVDQMIEKVKAKLKEFYIPAFLSRFFTKNIPNLKRWNKSDTFI